jgi:hypothetical protein
LKIKNDIKRDRAHKSIFIAKNLIVIIIKSLCARSNTAIQSVRNDISVDVTLVALSLAFSHQKVLLKAIKARLSGF